MRPVAVILAAGASSRMGRPKALLTWGGRTFLEAMVDALLRAEFTDIAVVTGADAEAVRPEAERLRLTVLSNCEWESGRMSSVRTAARHAAAAGAGLLLWPVDCPGVCAGTIAGLVADFARNPAANLVPSHDRRGGHPVVLTAGTCTAILESRWDNLRDAMRCCGAERRFLVVDDPGVLDNVNTPSDLGAFLGARSSEASHA